MIEIIDLEIMTDDEIEEAVVEAVQKASSGDTAMFIWLNARARFQPCGRDELRLQRILDRVRNSVTG